MKTIDQCILAVQFLTRLPISKRSVPCEPSDFRGAMWFFTSIGLLIGSMQYIGYLVMAAAVGPLLGAVAAYVIGIWATGGLHLDGLADVWDGFGANQSATRTLEIMKDSRVGTFGVIALLIDMSVHVAAFYTLKDAPQLLIGAPICAKYGVCLLCFIGKNLKEGMGAFWIENITAIQLLVNGLVAAGIGCLLVGGIAGIGAIVWVTAIVWYLNKYSARRLGGGITGDVLGACNQLVEWGVLGYIVACMRHGM